MSVKHNHSPKVSLGKVQGKYRGSKSEKQLILEYLDTHIATVTMISEATGIPIRNVCWRKFDLKKQGKLRELEKALCKSTGFMVFYLTTKAL